jgi:hypothetical protein
MMMQKLVEWLAGETEVDRENLPQCRLFITNSTCWPDTNPGRRGGKPASNSLSYGTAFFHLYVTRPSYRVPFLYILSYASGFRFLQEYPTHHGGIICTFSLTLYGNIPCILREHIPTCNELTQKSIAQHIIQNSAMRRKVSLMLKLLQVNERIKDRRYWMWFSLSGYCGFIFVQSSAPATFVWSVRVELQIKGKSIVCFLGLILLLEEMWFYCFKVDRTWSDSGAACPDFDLLLAFSKFRHSNAGRVTSRTSSALSSFKVLSLSSAELL